MMDSVMENLALLGQQAQAWLVPSPTSPLGRALGTVLGGRMSADAQFLALVTFATSFLLSLTISVYLLSPRRGAGGAAAAAAASESGDKVSVMGPMAVQISPHPPVS